MFSELVDQIVASTQRNERLADIAMWLNDTLRECQSLALFSKDHVEDSIVVDAEPFIWDRPRYMRRLNAVRYKETGHYPKMLRPGHQQRGVEYYYYPATTYFVFAGVSIGQHVEMSFYERARTFLYYAPGSRPAVFNEETGTWSYLPDYDIDDNTRELARHLVGHWLLADWQHLLREGTVAKLYKNLSDMRAATSYSLFEKFKVELLRVEALEATQDSAQE